MIKESTLTFAWRAAVEVAKNKGYTFTAECMNHAGFGGGSSKTYYNDSYVFEKVKNSSSFSSLTNNWISQYKNTGKTYFSESIEFTSSDVADLYYSIQHANISASIQSNGNMLITITDRYDFDQIRFGISLGVFGNNVGLILQEIGAIDPFNITIQGYLWAGFPDSGSGGGSTSGEYEVNRYTEYGTCYPQTTINFRSTPNASTSSNIIGQYYVGESVNYDLVVLTNKYAYISWVGASSGTRRYMAVRDMQTGERWATIV